MKTQPTQPLPLQQSPEFALALRAIGHSPHTQNGHILLQRRCLGLPVSMASRITLTDPKALISLPKTLLILGPDHPAPWLFTSGAVPLMTPATVAELDLTASTGLMLSRQHQKWRNRLRHAQNQSLRLSHGPMKNDIHHWLYKAEIAAQKDKSYRSYPLALTHAFTQLDPDQSRLFTALKGGEILAAMLFLRHGPVATYQIGHTTPKGRRLSAHTFLLWQAARWLKSQGHSRLDLGVIDTITNPGLARFKLGSGARSRALGGTWLRLPGLSAPARLLARWDRTLFTNPPLPG